jgi:hypothetical protein
MERIDPGGSADGIDSRDIHPVNGSQPASGFQES